MRGHILTPSQTNGTVPVYSSIIAAAPAATFGAMTDSWSRPVTVEEMYGEWDYDAAVAALDRSLGPRPSTSVLYVVLDIGGHEGQHAVLMAERTARGPSHPWSASDHVDRDSTVSVPIP